MPKNHAGPKTPTRCPIDLDARAEALPDEAVEHILQHFSCHHYDENAPHGDENLGFTKDEWVAAVVRTSHTRGIPIPDMVRP